MAPRTDIHRPSAIVPADYEYVAPEYLRLDDLGAVLMLAEFRRQIKAHMASTGGTYSRHEHGGNCMVCGNPNAVYTILFYHAPTNSYVRMGTDCAEEVDARFNDADVQGLRRVIADARARKAGKAKAQAMLEDEGLSDVWQLYCARAEALASYNEQVEEARARFNAEMATRQFKHGGDQLWHAEYKPALPDVLKGDEELTIADIVGRLIKYGSVSEKQINYLRKLMDRIASRAEIQAQRAAEAEAAAPVPTGRIVIEGEVLTTKLQESDFGSVLKMLVKADAGWKVWSTVPAAMERPERGARVRFKATVEASKDDPKFGFAKRPCMV